jgi:hypothetical protein
LFSALAIVVGIALFGHDDAADADEPRRRGTMP